MEAVHTPTPLTALRRKDLLGIADLSAGEIQLILDTADAMKEVGQREIKKVPTLRGRTVVNLFFEPSTRTRTSFEIAEKRLSADTLNVANASGWTGPVTFNAKAMVRMGIGNDTLALGLALLSGGDLNSRVAFGPLGNLSVDGGLNLNLFDDEAGQFDASKVTTLNFTDPTP